MIAIPDELRAGPFHRRDALRVGVTSRMLQGLRFVRLHPSVYRLREHVMTEADAVAAAALALPADARTTGITRIRQLGLDHGSPEPVHLVRAGDLHRDLSDVFLHRTVLMPPTDDVGVTPAAAFLAFCVDARVIDAIKVGDWLLHRRHAQLEEIIDLARAQLWRAGALEARWVAPYLDHRARSLPESEMRVVLEFSGLPVAEVNASLDPSGALPYLPDLLYRRWRTAVEYEGRQHQVDRAVYGADLDRYADLRRAGVRYVQVTREKLRRPRLLVGEVYRELLAAGYDGPPPDLGSHWRLLFGLLRDVPGLHARSRRTA